jgi:hypothetical protein
MPVGGGATTTLAASRDAVDFAIDAVNVYWLGSGAVLSVPQSGGSVTTLASGRNDLTRIATDGTNVYWTERGPGRVMKVAIR